MEDESIQVFQLFTNSFITILSIRQKLARSSLCFLFTSTAGTDRYLICIRGWWQSEGGLLPRETIQCFQIRGREKAFLHHVKSFPVCSSCCKALYTAQYTQFWLYWWSIWICSVNFGALLPLVAYLNVIIMCAFVLCPPAWSECFTGQPSTMQWTLLNKSWHQTGG